MNIEEILNKVYTSELLSSEELHELTEWVCNKDEEIERLNDYISFYEDLSKKQNKEIERLKNRLEESQLAYLSVNEKNNKGIEELLIVKKDLWEAEGYYDEWLDKSIQILRGEDNE